MKLKISMALTSMASIRMLRFPVYDVTPRASLVTSYTYMDNTVQNLAEFFS